MIKLISLELHDETQVDSFFLLVEVRWGWATLGFWEVVLIVISIYFKWGPFQHKTGASLLFRKLQFWLNNDHVAFKRRSSYTHEQRCPGKTSIKTKKNVPSRWASSHLLSVWPHCGPLTDGYALVLPSPRSTGISVALRSGPYVHRPSEYPHVQDSQERRLD